MAERQKPAVLKTAGLRHGAGASLLAGGFLPPHGANRKMQPNIITTCWTQLAVDDARHLWELRREGSEQLFVARMPRLHGHNASAVRADIARESPFGTSRFFHPCKVHGNFRALALLNPSVGMRRGVTNKWVTIHSQHEPVSRKRGSPSRYFNQLALVLLSRDSGLRSMR